MVITLVYEQNNTLFEKKVQNVCEKVNNDLS